jgi:hypothetical protein
MWVQIKGSDNGWRKGINYDEGSSYSK